MALGAFAFRSHLDEGEVAAESLAAADRVGLEDADQVADVALDPFGWDRDGLRGGWPARDLVSL